jgi:hypothetical protein
VVQLVNDSGYVAVLVQLDKVSAYPPKLLRH